MTTQGSYSLGILFIILVSLIQYPITSIVLRTLYSDDQTYDYLSYDVDISPFTLTYVCTSLFIILIPIRLLYEGFLICMYGDNEDEDFDENPAHNVIPWKNKDDGTDEVSWMKLPTRTTFDNKNMKKRKQRQSKEEDVGYQKISTLSADDTIYENEFEDDDDASSQVSDHDNDNGDYQGSTSCLVDDDDDENEENDKDKNEEDEVRQKAREILEKSDHDTEEDDDDNDNNNDSATTDISDNLRVREEARMMLDLAEGKIPPTAVSNNKDKNASSSSSEEEEENKKKKDDVMSTKITKDYENDESFVILSHQQHINIALRIAPLWFISNYCYNMSIQYTSIISYTALSATGLLFTYAFAILSKDENFTKTKLLGIIAVVIGTVLTAIHDASLYYDDYNSSNTPLIIHDVDTPDRPEDLWDENETPEDDTRHFLQAVWGDILGIISAMTFGAYTILIRKRCRNSKKGGGEMVMSMNLLLGYVGLVNAICLLPFALYTFFTMYHNNSLNQDFSPTGTSSTDDQVYIDENGFIMHNHTIHNTQSSSHSKITWVTIMGYLVVQGLLDNVLSDYLWSRCVLLTSGTVATTGLGLTIPISFILTFIIPHVMKIDLDNYEESLSSFTNSVHTTIVNEIEMILGSLLVFIGFLFVIYGDEEIKFHELKDKIKTKIQDSTKKYKDKMEQMKIGTEDAKTTTIEFFEQCRDNLVSSNNTSSYSKVNVNDDDDDESEDDNDDDNSNDESDNESTDKNENKGIVAFV